MKVLINRPTLEARVAELANELSEYYRGKELTVIVMLNGGMIFAADLLRNMSIELQVDSMALSSYENTASSGKIKWRSQLKLPVAGRHILLIDDILDSGRTMAHSCAFLRDSGAASVRSCVLLDKKARRKSDGLPRADWCAFDIPDVFVVGYGLDVNERFRNLPEIVDPEL